MARGWESKSVEEQQAEAQSQKQLPQRTLTPTQLQQKQRLESLTLQKRRVEQQMAAARDPRHQEMLRSALADLEAQITRIIEEC